MGEFRFRIPVEWKLDPYHANSIHVVGLDGIPWPCRIAVADDDLEPTTRKIVSVSRNRDESGRLYVVYPFTDRGEMLICTGTVPVREEPYELLTELARGTLNRLRNQISIWEEGGLSVEDSIHETILVATGYLSDSILSKNSERRDTTARLAIESAMDAIFDLSEAFGEQVTEFRRTHDQLGNFWMANAVGTGDQFEPSLCHEGFDLLQACLAPECETQQQKLSDNRAENFGKRVIVGPWLDASVGGMPQRLVDVDDFSARKDQLLIACRQYLEQLPSTTSLVHVVSGLNGVGHRHLSYPQQLQVTIDMLQVIDESTVNLPTMISFDFPWAERLAGAVGGVHPLQIADSLLRKGLPISFLGLEINLDYWPNGSVIRDPLQWIDLIDVWSQLGLPLILLLRAPCGTSQSDAEEVDKASDRTKNQTKSNVTDEQRIKFLSTVMPMTIARPAVHGMVWRQWGDADDARFPLGGFVDSNGADKLFSTLVERMKCLKGPRD